MDVIKAIFPRIHYLILCCSVLRRKKCISERETFWWCLIRYLTTKQDNHEYKQLGSSHIHSPAATAELRTGKNKQPTQVQMTLLSHQHIVFCSLQATVNVRQTEQKTTFLLITLLLSDVNMF